MGFNISRRQQIVFGFGFLILIAGFFQNCSKIGFSDATGLLAQQSVVCNPLDGAATTATGQNGMVGKIQYVPLASQSASSLNGYPAFQSQAVTSDSTVYLSQFNVPTRPWTDGFSTNGSNALVDDQGNKLLEYFSLQMQTNLQLTATDAPGYYQFAVISDDGGFVTTTDASGNTQTLAGSTGGWHSTKSECGQTAVYLDGTTSLPMNLLYYQGPRTAIAMVMVWRKISSSTIPDQTGCGVTDGGFFKEPSAGVSSSFEKMQAAGWDVVPAQNFFLPASAGANPCAAR